MTAPQIAGALYWPGASADLEDKLRVNAAPLIAGTQMYLAAVNCGMSGCYVGYLNTDRASEILDLPEDVACLFLLPIGYAGEAPEGVERRSLPEFAFYDAWPG